MNLKSVTCPHCFGKGTVLDYGAVGPKARRERQKSRLSLRQVAERMGISAMYLSQLERDLYNWTPELLGKFVNAVSPRNKTIYAKKQTSRIRS